MRGVPCDRGIEIETFALPLVSAGGDLVFPPPGLRQTSEPTTCGPHASHAGLVKLAESPVISERGGREREREPREGDTNAPVGL